ncbi:hypothetical protein B0H16DRAFT_1454616 [Mycena metata]|uniref:Uncharacterized protein n=1 Tax=Mycena metata TaxID=1033252 RepID=A0AAD7JJR4_9AGAR|nr:hypothetical protein B0H16DRAFT_1454616 [Mycena metata]
MKGHPTPATFCNSLSLEPTYILFLSPQNFIRNLELLPPNFIQDLKNGSRVASWLPGYSIKGLACWHALARLSSLLLKQAVLCATIREFPLPFNFVLSLILTTFFLQHSQLQYSTTAPETATNATVRECSFSTQFPIYNPRHSVDSTATSGISADTRTEYKSHILTLHLSFSFFNPRPHMRFLTACILDYFNVQPRGDTNFLGFHVHSVRFQPFPLDPCISNPSHHGFDLKLRLNRTLGHLGRD